MKAPAVLINARAGGVRKDPELVQRMRARLPAECLRLTAEPGEIEPALRALLATGCDTLMVVGGDGTAGATLSALVRACGDREPPRVALVGGGTVNTIARSLGATGRPDVNLGRWLRAEAPLREAVHPLLRVDPAGGDVHHGLIFGNGALCHWLELYDQTAGGAVAAAWTVARSIGSIAVGGRTARALFEHFDARIAIDDGAPEQTRLTAVAASTVRDIGLGFEPFHTAGSDPRRFHWIQTDAEGPGFAAEVASQLVGRRERKASPLRHASPTRVALELSRPQAYTVDADLFPPVSRVTVSAGPAIRFAAA